MELISSEPVLAKKVEEAFEEEKEEHTYNERLMGEHSKSLPKLSQLKKLLKELEEKLPKEVAIKVADVLPVNEETAKEILVSFDEDESKAKEIVEIVKKYV